MYVRMSAAFLVLFAILFPAHAQERFALLIGNSRYEHAKPLRNPENDIEVVAQSLETVGFRTRKVLNADLATLTAQIDAFVSQDLAGADRPVVLVYFAGHGVQRQGTNYLLPVDSLVSDAGSLTATTLAADKLLAGLSAIDASLQIVILDACRDDPFGDLSRGAVSLQDGLAAAVERTGQVIAYSTAPGRTAADGDTGTSPYAAAFAETLLMPGLSLRGVFDRVREKVMERTRGSQEPWESTAIYDDFHFIEPEAMVAISEVEALLWDNAVLADSAESYQRYLSRFTEGRFASLARMKIDNINKDFSFRKQSETFPILVNRGGSIDFCKQELQTDSMSDAFEYLFGLYDYQDELIYIDIEIPLKNIMCEKNEINDVSIEAVHDIDDCHEVIHHFSDEESDTRHVEKCVEALEFAPLGWGEHLEKQSGLVISQYDVEGLYLSGMSAPYYRYRFDPQEGHFEAAFVSIQGLVRVHTFLQEIFVSYFLEPADPAELGLTWKFQNTLEAYRKIEDGSGVKPLSMESLYLKRQEEARYDEAPLTSYWNHEGSVIGLFEIDDHRTLSYLEPGEALRSAGVEEFAVLFEGTMSGSGTYSGTAYTYPPRCEPQSYATQGTVSPEEDRIVLQGEVPVFDDLCRQVGTRSEAIVLTFTGTASADDDFFMDEDGEEDEDE